MEKTTNSGTSFDRIGGYFQGFRRGVENLLIKSPNNVACVLAGQRLNYTQLQMQWPFSFKTKLKIARTLYEFSHSSLPHHQRD
jgi:hypothetical protein